MTMMVKLYRLLMQGNVDKFKEAFQFTSAEDLKYPAETTYSLMHLAAGSGRVDVLQYLLSKGCTLDHLSVYGYTPLMVASAMNEFGAAKFLISRGADLHAMDELGRTFSELTDQPEAFQPLAALLGYTLPERSEEVPESQRSPSHKKIVPIIKHLIPHVSPEREPKWLPPLLQRIHQVITLIHEAPARKAWMDRRALLEKLLASACQAETRDYALIALLGADITAHQQVSDKLPLSEAELPTLRRRHARLLRTVEQRCDELVDKRAFQALQVLSAKLTVLRALDLSCLPVGKRRAVSA